MTWVSTNQTALVYFIAALIYSSNHADAPRRPHQRR